MARVATRWCPEAGSWSPTPAAPGGLDDIPRGLQWAWQQGQSVRKTRPALLSALLISFVSHGTGGGILFFEPPQVRTQVGGLLAGLEGGAWRCGCVSLGFAHGGGQGQG